MRAYFTILFLLFISTTFGQNGLHQIGSRPAGMGHTYAAEKDSWSLFYNPAGISSIQTTNLLFAYESRFNIEGLNNIGAGAITHTKIGSVGISAFRFGDDNYNEQTASLAFGNKYGIASLGGKLNYVQYTLEGFGDKGIISFDVGGTAMLGEHLIVGAYVRNINQAKLSDLEDEKVPTLMNAGISYLPIEKLHINVEAEKDLDYDAILRMGLEYNFYKKLFIRTGISTGPFHQFAGLGFHLSLLQVDYAMSKDRNLGYSHQASIILKLLK